MGEERKIFLTIFGLVLGGIIAYVLSNTEVRLWFYDLYVDYKAYIDIGEDIYLREDITYFPDDPKLTMLYRNFNAPLTYEEEIDKPFIKVVDVNGPFIPYIKDWRGRVYTKGGNDEDKGVIRRKAQNNEVGIYSREGFDGKQTLSSEFLLYPPVKDDGVYQHVNIKLADKHVYYRHVNIILRDERGIIEAVYPHLPLYSLRREGDRWIIEGRAPDNTIVEVELVLKGLKGEHFYQPSTDIPLRVKNANEKFLREKHLRDSFRNILLVMLFGFPVILFVVYSIFGKEKTFYVPRFLSFIPNKNRKPWFVNMVFSGDATETDESAYFSTLLDMERRGIIKIEEEPGDVRIRVKEMNVEDPYERKILMFIMGNASEDGLFSIKDMEKKVNELVKSKDVDELKKLKKSFDEIIKFNHRESYKDLLSLKGFHIVRVCGFLLSLVAIGIYVYSHTFRYAYTYDITVLSLISFILLNIPHILLPKQIFGRWKGSYYKERLEWEAFKNFLSDLAMMKKYAPEDMVIWKDWLIYGVALGVGENVEKALEELNIKIPEVKKVRLLRDRTRYYYGSLDKGISSLTSTSTKGLGGFGVGGGFGGGGAGGR